MERENWVEEAKQKKHRNWPWAILGSLIAVGGWAIVTYWTDIDPIVRDLLGR